VPVLSSVWGVSGRMRYHARTSRAGACVAERALEFCGRRWGLQLIDDANAFLIRGRRPHASRSRWNVAKGTISRYDESVGAVEFRGSFILLVVPSCHGESGLLKKTDRLQWYAAQCRRHTPERGAAAVCCGGAGTVLADNLGHVTVGARVKQRQSRFQGRPPVACYDPIRRGVYDEAKGPRWHTAFGRSAFH
jgi:hypothetical protein